MSHRTIIEINHDFLHDYEQNPDLWANFLAKVKSNDWSGRWTRETPGIHKIGERHHSESLVIEVNGRRETAKC